MRSSLLFALLLVTACGGSPPGGSPPNITGYLAPDVAAQLEENGLFPLSVSVREERPVTPEEAVRFAAEFIHGQTSYDERMENAHVARLERIDLEHGSIVDFQELRPGRVLLPTTPYILPDTAREEVRNVYDAHYLVPFYNRLGFQALAAIVPAEEPGFWTDRTRSGNADETPAATGRMLSYFGVHAASEYPVPLTPECAVWLVGTATDRMTVALPEPVFPGRPYGPLTLYWKLQLNQPVETIGEQTAAADQTDVLYVGLDFEPTSDGTRQSVPVPALFRELPDQPGEDSIRVIWGREADEVRRWTRERAATELSGAVIDSAGQPPVYLYERLAIRPGAALNYEKVRLASGTIEPRMRHFPCRSQ